MIPRALLDSDLDLSAGARLVWAVLASHANDARESWPSRQLIADESGLSVSSVRRALLELRDQNYVSWVGQHEDGIGQVSNRYTLTPRLSVNTPLSTENRAPAQGEQGPGSQGTTPLFTESHEREPLNETQRTRPKERDAQGLVAEWIDHCDARPPQRVIGHLAREIKALIAEGIPYDEVRAGVAEWHRKGLHPSTLASVVHEIRNPRRPAGRPTTDDKVLAGLALAQQLRGAQQHQPQQIGA